MYRFARFTTDTPTVDAGVRRVGPEDQAWWVAQLRAACLQLHDVMLWTGAHGCSAVVHNVPFVDLGRRDTVGSQQWYARLRHGAGADRDGAK